MGQVACHRNDAIRATTCRHRTRCAEAKVIVEDIEDNPGFFRVKLFIVPHFQIEGMDINLSLVSQMPKAKN